MPGVAAVGGMLHPSVPVSEDWATGGCPLVAPAPRGSAGEIPRDPVCPSRQVAASLVSTINLAGGRWKAKGRHRVKPAAALAPRPVKTWALRVKQRLPLLQPVGSQGTRVQSSQQKENQVPTVAEERGFRSCQRWPRTEPASCPPRPGGRSRQLPQHAHSCTPQLPKALTLLTQSSNIQNTHSGFNLATVHKTPITATFPPSQGFRLSRSGSKQSGAGRSGAQLHNAGMPAGR